MYTDFPCPAVLFTSLKNIITRAISRFLFGKINLIKNYELITQLGNSTSSKNSGSLFPEARGEDREEKDFANRIKKNKEEKVEET